MTTPSFESLLRHASRQNTRLPPIARRSSSPLPCQMATLSRNKLHKEAAAKDPDLRRCLGHHRLLRRSIEEAQADMQRYMASVRLESDDDEDDIFDDSDEEEPEEEYGISAYRGRGRAPAPVQLQHDVSSSPSVVIRDQITGAVRSMIRRRSSHSPTPPPFPNGNVNGNGNGNLARVAAKNSSCSDVSKGHIQIQVHIQVQSHPQDDESPNMDENQTRRLEHSPSFAARGRKYVSRLGFRRRWPPGPLQAVTT